MKDGDQLKKQLLASKTKSTPVNLDTSHSLYTPFRESKLDNKYLRKLMIKRFKNNEINLLDQEFKSAHFSEQSINDFFQAEYKAILHWLLTGSSNSNSFEFILRVFPTEALKNKLRENDFYYLTGLLNGCAGMEELGLLTENEKELNKERFRVLLKIDPEGVQDFMKRNENADFMKSSALEDYKNVLIEKQKWQR